MQTTDGNLWNEHLERPMVRGLLPAHLDQQVVLDAGCASCAHAAWLADRAAQITAIDISPAMIAAARQRCGPVVKLQVASFAAPVPFPSDSFDGVLCPPALHYVRDIDGSLGEFAHVLRAGGWLVERGHRRKPDLHRLRPVEISVA